MNDLRLPPQNIEAEQSVLGSILIDEEAIFKVAEFLTPDHFYKIPHQDIYQCIIELYNQRESIDVLTLSAMLKKKKLLKKIGGTEYLSKLVAKVPTAAHIEEYGKLIKEASIRRKLISLAAKVDEVAYQEDKKIDSLLDKVEQDLIQISQSHTENDFVHISKLLEEAYERAEELNKDPGKLRGIPTGFNYLDGILGGFQKSDLIILASRPSVGKTSLALDIARHAAVKENKTVAIFSLEMSNTQLMDRILSMQVGIGLWDLRMGRIKDEAFSKLSDAMGILSEAKIYIDDTPSINIMEIRTRARKLMIEKGVDFIIVDYLQLITGRQHENRVQEVSETSRLLKGIARELSIPLLAISQLSRAIEQRSGSTPMLSDLRDSGSIEQDADVVLFLNRMEEDDEERSDNVKLTVAKHRNGPIGSVDLFFIKEQARFRELDKTR